MNEQKKPQAEVVDGYRLLLIGEVILETDQYSNKRGKWIPAFKGSVGRPVHKHNYPYRRRIEPVDNTGVQVHNGGPYVAIEVHREALAEIERLNAELRDARAKNPPKQQPEPDPEWFDLTPFAEHVLRQNVDYVKVGLGECWEVVRGCAGKTVDAIRLRFGFDQFRCLLKDAPPEYLKPAESPYGYCPVCGARGKSRERRINGNDACENGHLYPSKDALTEPKQATQPAESPDDWVDITETHGDMIPRVGIDWFWDNSIKRWVCQERRHSKHTIGEHHKRTEGRGRHRCRRSDLPPIQEPKPATQREVLLYWYDGNVVGRYADCPPSDPSFVPLVLRDGKVFIETETREVVR